MGNSSSVEPKPSGGNRSYTVTGSEISLSKSRNKKNEQIPSIKDIWNRYVEPDPDLYFLQVYERLMAKNRGIKRLLKEKKDNPESLRRFASNVRKFFWLLVQKEGNWKEIEKLAKECGNRHAAYADWTFEVSRSI